MTGGPKVKVGDRIVALATRHSYSLCQVNVGRVLPVASVSEDGKVFVNGRPAGDGHCEVTSWRLADQPEPYVPERGHRVRVVLEGEVESPRPYGVYIGKSFVDYVDVVSIERLPDPEPEPQRFDVWVNSGDLPFIYTGEAFIGANGGLFQREDIPGPLTLSLRDGKPIGGAE